MADVRYRDPNTGMFVPLGTVATYPTAIGGDVTYAGGYAIHTFTSSGTFLVSGGTLDVEVLLVGGGGGGLSYRGGGGGGGGVVSSSQTGITGSKTIVVGAGGAGGQNNEATWAAVGGNTTAFSMTAYGGGTGNVASPGGGGGAPGGGGATAPGMAGGSQGYAGGGHVGTSSAGGGGGAGGIGQDGAGTGAGIGGIGIASSISGTQVFYGGGGGGAGQTTAAAGTHGGGSGGVGASGTSGTANRGGGGGGGGNSVSVSGGNGGTGVVIVKYLTPPVGRIQDEGTVLAAQPSLNFVGAGVTATDDSANNRTLVTIAAGGSTILSGTTTPTGVTGNAGDYYLDTDDNVLYGPKNAGFGAAQSTYTSQSPGGSVSFTGNFGADILFAVPGRVTGLRHYRQIDASQSGRTLKVWSNAGALLASVVTTGETGSGWKTGVLSTPVAVTAGQTVRVSYHLTSADMIPRSSRSSDFTNSNLTRKDTYGDSGLTDLARPVSASALYEYFADVVFEPEVPNVWPVAVKSVPPGGTTNQLLAKTSATDYAATWATYTGDPAYEYLKHTPTGSTANAYYGTSDSSKAIDGNTSTPWESGPSQPNWIRLDLGSSKTVSRVRLYCAGTGNTPSTIVVESSANDSTWTTRHTISGMPANGWTNHDFTAATDRYWRLSSTFPWWALYEYEVYGATSLGVAKSHIIRDEGTALAVRQSLNFVGAGVTTTDDSANDYTTVTVPGGGLDQTTADARYVQLTGGTLTGPVNTPGLGASPPTVTYVGSASAEGSSVSTLNVVMPSGVIEGDLLLMLFTWNEYNSSVTDSQGFALPTGFTYQAHVGVWGNGKCGGAWYYKIATAADVSATKTFTFGGGDVRISVLAFRNAGMPTQFFDGNESTTIAANALGSTIASNGMCIAAATTWGTTTKVTSAYGTQLALHSVGSAANSQNTDAVFWGGAVTAGSQSPAVTFTWNAQPGGTGLIFVPVDTSNSRIVSTTDIDFGGTKGPKNLRTPTSAGDAASKGYVDTTVAGVGVPLGAVDKDMLRWSATGTLLATATRTTDGTNGLLAWCRSNAVPLLSSQTSNLAAGYESDKAIDGSTANFACTSDIANSWWRVDVGAGKGLVPTSVSIYGRSGANNLRHFNIQGSNDQTAWTNLYSTGGTANQVPSGSWLNVVTPGVTPYRYLRVLSTGTDAAGTSNFLLMGELEVYGTLRDTSTSSTWVAERDAPSDSKQYARKDGAWAEVAGGGGGGYIGPWSAAVAYPAGSVVTYNNRSWGTSTAVAAGGSAPALPSATTIIPNGVDNAADALPIIVTEDGASGSSALFSNSTFTTEAGEPNSPSSTQTKNRSGWLKYSPATSGSVTFSTIGSGGDTAMSIWLRTGSGVFDYAQLSHIAFDDDAGGSGTSQIVQSVSGGATYYFQIGAYGGGIFNYKFNITNGRASVDQASPWRELGISDAGLPPSVTTLDSLTDVDTAGVANTNVLTYTTGYGVWVGAPVSVPRSDAVGSNTADKAWDNNNTTIWSTGGLAAWSTADFGVPVSAGRIFASSNTPAANWTLAGSNDNSAWTTVVASISATVAGSTTNFTPATWRYWRMHANGSAYIDVNSFTLYNLVPAWVPVAPSVYTGTPIYQWNKHTPNTATESGHYASYLPSWAYDGTTSTQWMSSNSSPSWIQFDFATAKTVSRLRINTTSGLAVTVASSDDGSTFTTRHTFTSASGWNQYDFTAATARYWRLTAPQAYWEVWEIEYYGSTIQGYAVPHAVYDEGTLLTPRAGLNIIGPAVAATDDSANDATKVTISTPNILVLGPVDAVPGGTPAGTVIIRTT